MTKSKSSKRRAKPRVYTGDLAEPIYEPIAGGAISKEMRKKFAEQRASARQFANLKRLFDWYKIDLSAIHPWANLAIALAEAHVPGMQVIYESRPKRGRRQSWKAGRYEELLQDVNEVRSKKTMTISAAIDALIADAAYERVADDRDIPRYGRPPEAMVESDRVATVVMYLTDLPLGAKSCQLIFGML